MKKNKVLISIVIIVLIGFGLFFLLNKPKIITPSSSLNEIIDHEIKEESDQRIITASYPSVGVENIDNELKSFVEGQVNDFKSIEYVPYGGNNLQYYFFLEYFYSRFNKNIISFKFNSEYFTGGAHPNHDIMCFTYNLQNGKKMELADFFIENSDFLKRISDYSVNSLMQNEYADEEWIKEGAGENIDNFQRFIVTENSFVFYFPPYQVAPYAAGEQQIIISFSELKDILNPLLFSNYDFSVNKGIYVLSPNEGRAFDSFIRVEGYLNGNGWAPFEGVAGRVELLNEENDILTSAVLEVPGNWMQLPVYFRAYLNFNAGDSKTGKLVFYNDNASGLEEKNRKFIMPVSFKSVD